MKKTADEKREYMRLYMAERRKTPEGKEKSRDACRKWQAANRELSNAKARAWRAANPERVKANNAAWYAARSPEDLSAYNRKAYRQHRRAHHINKKFGLSTAQYDALLAAQNGCCVLCPQVDLPEKRLAVDHDHKTGKIRALLCDRCNRGIGFFDEIPERLRAAADYLESHDLTNIDLLA
jgi:hypothetical protein